MELSPADSAEIANSAYTLRDSTDMRRMAAAAPRTRHAFDLPHAIRLTGTTGLGAAPLQKTTGFGYVAWGHGARQGECLISVRGTFLTSACDWMTNARMGGVRGPSGYCVHAGFWAAAQTLLPQVRASLRGRDVSAIHLVGHSLGGAMATLLADCLGDTGCQLRLYTFGAPRAGVALHAEYLTDTLGASNIYRAYHDTDVVPMVPVYPYSHLPHAAHAYAMKGPGKVISPAAHSMTEYARSVGSMTWANLPLQPSTLGSLEAAQAWLAGAADAGGSSIMLSATALKLILSSLDWILKQIGHGLGLALLGGATIVDRLAHLLYSGALQSVRLAEMIRQLMTAAMRFMGRTIQSATNITLSFVQYVLGLLFRVIASVASHAVDSLTR
jgi:triacylglycerol lipase